MSKWVFAFGDHAAEGNRDMRNQLGGKGANLAEMSNLGLPVPPGFTISTDVCAHYYGNEGRFPDGLAEQVDRALDVVGKLAGKRFGDNRNPLLVSVRSGARSSMPGMMDTVLNLGLNDTSVEAVERLSGGDPRFAWDSYRRFIMMYADVVLHIDRALFESEIEKLKHARGLYHDTELGVDEWQRLVTTFKSIVQRISGQPFPQDPREQLWGAIVAVIASWMNDRAKVYRSLHGIPESWGTAVTVQAMVFGNRGPSSATGVVFSRNPSTGANSLYGEFLTNAQGEDVVAGVRTPQAITRTAGSDGDKSGASMEELLPDAFADLLSAVRTLEAHARDMQDIEFTVEQGKLWLLQTRNGKRTGRAAVRIAVEMAGEGVLTHEEALLRVEPTALEQLLHPTIDPGVERTVVTTGLPASPGAVSGEIVFTSAEAVSAKEAGRTSILVRQETSPEDIKGMLAAAGVLTRLGGMTSHAAVVARGWGKPCVCGASAVFVDVERGIMSIGDTTWTRGDIITIDGGSGEVLNGKVATRPAELTDDFRQLMGWARDVRRLQVRTNAETPEDARQAVLFGAEGIGLCRTEHMFFQSDRIRSVREMILSDDAAGRRTALAKLLPMQRQDFLTLFTIMHGLPVNIRLLDPPLHEFLPHTDGEITATAQSMGVTEERIRSRVEQLEEFNPMLGFRGCRLAIAYPEIVETQTRAIFEAAVEIKRRTGDIQALEIMIPLSVTRTELDIVKGRIDATARAVMAEAGAVEIPYQVGSMIELPRAALLAGALAETAEFFSFGTNDLTQATIGISRDDAGAFLGTYVEQGVFDADPFVSIDREGVGELVRIAIQRGRTSRPSIKLGVCGEHGGDPASISFFEEVGLDYVSCSPFRVPVASLAAAQARLTAAQVERTA